MEYIIIILYILLYYMYIISEFVQKNVCTSHMTLNFNSSKGKWFVRDKNFIGQKTHSLDFL